MGTAGASIAELLEKISKTNGILFQNIHSKQHGRSLNNLKDYFNETDKKHLIAKHQMYQDLKDMTSLSYKYINIMRDPLSWFASNYYSSMDRWQKQPISTKGPQEYGDILSHNETLTDCVSKGRKFCSVIPCLYLEYFAGNVNDRRNQSSFLSNGRGESPSEEYMEILLEMAKTSIE